MRNRRRWRTFNDSLLISGNTYRCRIEYDNGTVQELRMLWYKTGWVVPEGVDRGGIYRLWVHARFDVAVKPRYWRIR